MLSVAIHALTAAILVAAVVILVNWYDTVQGWLVGGGLAAIALWLRPRTIRPPKHAVTISRTEAPTMFEVADRIAEKVGASPVTTIHLHDLLFRCAHVRIGVRREPTLVIGLPLLVASTPRERAAMLGVAFAHDVAGDPARGPLVRSALDTAAAWRRSLLDVRVDRYSMPDDPVVALFAPAFPAERMGSQIIGKLAGWVLGSPLFLAEFALTRLVSGQSRLAVHHADQVAARAVSSQAVIEYLDALTMAEIRLTPILSAVRRGETLGGIREAVLNRNADHDMRRDASVAKRTWRDLEPPTALRAALLEASEAEEGSVGLDRGESDRIDAELERHLTRSLRELSQIT
ncbi:M48 family metallopeptidase [Planotetraspora silvatica]|uniref:M48 family metallopeptidase n=1 Tax=Planotetraspora silvatica TaxID=234614 RepID=UPI0019502B9F|nr:M48 family metallopeptidase [Planotetraspora silvatica]